MKKTAGSRCRWTTRHFCLLAFYGVSATAQAQSLHLPELRPPHGEIGPTFWEQHHWLVIIAAAVILAVAALVILWLRRPRPVVVVPPEMLARRALEALRGRPEDGALTMEASRIVRNYLISIFMLPPEELTTAELVRALETRPQISPELVAAIGAFLRRSDELKFAPALQPAQAGIVGRATELVETVEKNRSRLAPGAPAQPATDVPSPTAA